MEKEKTCRFGHQCDSDCQKTKDCPCLADHCCELSESVCDRTFCSSRVEKHTCGRELSSEDEKYAQELGLPIAFREFCVLPKVENLKREE